MERGSVYAVLRTLVKEAHVREERTEREGRRPERTVFAITPAGRRHYRELLRRAWSEIPVFASAVARRAAVGLTHNSIVKLLVMVGNAFVPTFTRSSSPSKSMA